MMRSEDDNNNDDGDQMITDLVGDNVDVDDKRWSCDKGQKSKMVLIRSGWLLYLPVARATTPAARSSRLIAANSPQIISS